tara:strand:- start:2764 stop:3300 length:537 start_codon:yes stop_codon:yes gene_type:complete
MKKNRILNPYPYQNSLKKKDEYGYITKRMLDYVENCNGEGNYPTWTQLNEKYVEVSGGSNSMSHHLLNWRNKLTERPCGRYLLKITSFPSKFVDGYTVKYFNREVNPYIAKLKKLVHVLTCAADEATYPSVTNNIQSKLNSVYDALQRCKTNSDYKPNKQRLLNFNDYYRMYLPERLK